jgi:hypothetical protein
MDRVIELIVKYHEARAVCDTAAALTDYLQELADKILDEIVTTKPTTYAATGTKLRWRVTNTATMPP